LEEGYRFFNDLVKAVSRKLGVTHKDYEDLRLRDNWSISSQLTGAFQPLADMAKDVADTFKPYRSKFYVKRDGLQPLYGLLNIAKGVLYLIALVPLFLIGVAVSLAMKKPENIGYGLMMLASWLLDGVLSIVRGATQIAFTPLGWAKMAIRGLIYAFTSKEDLWIENRPGIQNLVKKDKDNPSTDKENLAMEVNSKYEKGIKRGEETGLTGEKLKTAKDFATVRNQSENYLKLFARPTESDDLTTNENEKTKNSDNDLSKKSNHT